ncbi:UDP-N-acetylmuramoyl-tripeptide--D-alanyl-D-alanine ligase [Candidatus Xiphinematobacter sp. Idaho Grape]|uniref:UDP-N-acetylmuramoyl-tripeptide--D-alanyl-D- alanine ligase n=1 Tax=Candidatus Xiphinematobacter sp. Idaho Grape TaxID=1704307 RepID=UPI000705A822|nr:UDP-N-acetylmuramoyl-tripeptide--D-alanyl-D-alanine ligase [Candidatus Xiphinematobacter sp. Idaho Grape]ALJ56530.1 UDP-N-acetylmuramoyl-tripeptide--D-alanyl-D-alanine ligase [Candidatus Xiphinematobacter sp. Idaho Grape]
MDICTIREVAEMCGGVLLQGNPQCLVSRLSRDTRTLQPGDVYIALRGVRFDGNQFLAQAEAHGASAAIVESLSTLPTNSQLAVILVPNSLVALQHLAESWRGKITPKVVCITGSNGKTTTKELTARVLARRYSVSYTQGNFNNHIGLPLTILATSSAHNVAVWEIGMNHRGEILPLAKLARPQIGIITNIGVAHIANMGSREAIAAEKGNLIRQIAPDGTLVLPAEDDFSKSLAFSSLIRTLFVGLGSGAVTASNIEVLSNGTRFIAHGFGQRAPVTLSIPGRHIVKDALFALAVGLELGISIPEGATELSHTPLLHCHPQLKAKRKVQFLDDSYNANPDSVMTALNTLSEIPCKGHRLAILGKMDELGAYAKRGYQKVAQAAAVSLVDTLVAVGEETFPLIEEATKRGMRNVYHIPDTPAAAQLLNSITNPGDLVLIKGSNSARMSRVIEQY